MKKLRSAFPLIGFSALFVFAWLGTGCDDEGSTVVMYPNPGQMVLQMPCTWTSMSCPTPAYPPPSSCGELPGVANGNPNCCVGGKLSSSPDCNPNSNEPMATDPMDQAANGAFTAAASLAAVGNLSGDKGVEATLTDAPPALASAATIADAGAVNAQNKGAGAGKSGASGPGGDAAGGTGKGARSGGGSGGSGSSSGGLGGIADASTQPAAVGGGSGSGLDTASTSAASAGEGYSSGGGKGGGGSRGPGRDEAEVGSDAMQEFMTLGELGKKGEPTDQGPKAAGDVNPMGSDDPEDYLRRMGEGEDIFARVHFRYRVAAYHWGQADGVKVLVEPKYTPKQAGHERPRISTDAQTLKYLQGE